MSREVVKARKVGDSLVITLPKGIAEEANVTEGDPLVVETTAKERILVRKDHEPVSPTQRFEIELDILKKEASSLSAKMDLGIWEHNSSMPTAHPGIEDSDLMAGTSLEWNWELRKLELAIAKKQLELFDAGGTV